MHASNNILELLSSVSGPVPKARWPMMTFLGCATGVLKPLKRITLIAPKEPTSSGMWALGSSS